MRKSDFPLSLHDLLLGQAHRVAQLLDRLEGVLLGLLVLAELREDGADVEDGARRVALDRPQVELKLKVFHISVHQFVQISLFLFVFLQS